MVEFNSKVNTELFWREFRANCKNRTRFSRVLSARDSVIADIDPSNMDEETIQVCQHITQALGLRQKYLWVQELPELPKKIPEPVKFDGSSVNIDPSTEVCQECFCLF